MSNYLKNTPSLLRTIAAILAVCILFAACNTQNNIVNPSPATWKIVISKNPGSAQNNLNAVAATSTTDAWAVGSFSNNHFDIQGSKALIEHWNGSTWSVVKSPKAPLGDSILNGIAAISPTNAWAVGYTFLDSNSDVRQTLIEHWNGTSWAVVASPNFANGAQLTAVTALSATDIWAVGYGNNPAQTFIEQSLIVHWDGKAWREVPNPNPGSGSNFLTGLAAVSTNDIWTVGAFVNGNNGIEMGEELIEHWNGTSWTVVQNPNAGVQGTVLSTIAAISTNDVWAVGSSSSSSPTNTLIEHWNGTSWSTVEGQNPGKASNTLGAVAVLSAHDIWAVGSSSSAFTGQEAQPLIEHWNGSSWSTITSPNIGTNNTTLDEVALVPHSTRIWAVGTGATYGTPITVPLPNTNLTTSETPVTAQTLTESCCS